jgi:hypothetical protein
MFGANKSWMYIMDDGHPTVYWRSKGTRYLIYLVDCKSKGDLGVVDLGGLCTHVDEDVM